MRFDIVQGAYKGRSRAISPADLQNMYPEFHPEEKARVMKALINCPGYRKVVALNTEGVGRGCYATSTGRMFAVVGNKFVEIDTDEVKTDRGTLLTSIGKCSLSDNGVQVLIVDGTYGYIYTLATDVLAKITDTDFPNGVTSCLFTDGYFIVAGNSTGQYQFSYSYDGTNWDALDFATAEYSADVIQAVTKTSNGIIFFVGKKTTELWSNVGTANLPWRRISGTVKEVGTSAPYSVATNGDHAFFVGYGANGSNGVFMSVGYDLQRISDSAIEYRIKQVSNITDAEAFTYTDETHSFYVVSFGYELTLCYDLSTGYWHVRGSYNPGTGQNIRQFANGYAFFNDRHYVTSYLDAYLYEMSLDVYDEGGSTIKRLIDTKILENSGAFVRFKKIRIEAEKGVGLIGGEAPRIMFYFSDDKGRTWSNERTISAGGIGEYGERMELNRLGGSYGRMFRLIMADPVKWIIAMMYVEAE
jgi:hypothetical protein